MFSSSKIIVVFIVSKWCYVTVLPQLPTYGLSRSMTQQIVFPYLGKKITLLPHVYIATNSGKWTHGFKHIHVLAFLYM